MIIKPLPIIVPVFNQEGAVIQYKRFPKDKTWRPLFDFNDAINGSALAGDVAQNTADITQLQTDVTALSGQIPTIIYPEHAVCFGDETRKVSGNWATAVSTSYPYNFTTYSLDLNNKASFKFLARSGQWVFFLLTAKSNTMGITQVKVNGTQIGSQDLYQATLNAAFVWQLSAITLTGGLQTVEFINTGKNASSTQYGTVITKFWGMYTP